MSEQSPLILDGKKVAEALYAKLVLEASLLPCVPRIAFVLVGEDPASQTYVRAKGKKCQDLGFQSDTIALPANISELDLIQKVRSLSRNKEIHGILVQLPLPSGIKKQNIIREIDPLKDVDGLHPENVGYLFQGEARFAPCTPAGIIEMLKFYQISVEGKRAVVVGRSEIVGKPMAQLLLSQNATVTICHSRTSDLAAETSRADILIAALGKPKLIEAKHVREGVVVVDVGIHRTGMGLVGDVDFISVAPKASAISPVPGGVGPLTIALLMKNLVLATGLQTKKS